MHTTKQDFMERNGLKQTHSTPIVSRRRQAILVASLLFAGMSIVPEQASAWSVWSKPRVMKNGDQTCNAISDQKPPRMDFLQIRQPDGANHYVVVIRSDAIPTELSKGEIKLEFPDGHQASLPFRRSAGVGAPIVMEKISASVFKDLIKRFGVSGNIQVSASTRVASHGTSFKQTVQGYGTGSVPELFEKCVSQF